MEAIRAIWWSSDRASCLLVIPSEVAKSMRCLQEETREDGRARDCFWSACKCRVKEASYRSSSLLLHKSNVRQGNWAAQPSGVRDDPKPSRMGTRTEGNYRQGRLRAVCRDTSLKCDRLITPRDCESESSELGGSRRRVNAGGRAVRQDEFVKTRRARQGHKDADGPGQCPTMRLD